MASPLMGLTLAVAANAPVAFAQAAVNRARAEAHKEIERVQKAHRYRESLVADLRELQRDGASLVRWTICRAIDTDN